MYPLRLRQGFDVTGSPNFVLGRKSRRSLGEDGEGALVQVPVACGVLGAGIRETTFGDSGASWWPFSSPAFAWLEKGLYLPGNFILKDIPNLRLRRGSTKCRNKEQTHPPP